MDKKDLDEIGFTLSVEGFTVVSSCWWCDVVVFSRCWQEFIHPQDPRGDDYTPFKIRFKPYEGFPSEVCYSDR